MEVNRIINGDALEVLKTLPDESVLAAISSPPYWGSLRDYRVPATVWDGDERCQHDWGDPQRAPWANSVAGPNGRKKNTRAGHWKSKESGRFCLRCGAWQGCLGQEPDPQAYVDHLVQVFREVRRVLRKDGTLWLNLGDTYWGKGPKRQEHRGNLRAAGLKNKDLAGIPWRVALALQADGWILRSDNVWNKPNCLSGGAILYTRTPAGETPVMVKDLVRRDPKTVELWDGERWTQCLSWIQRPRPDHPLEIALRSGQRIGCTPDHLWPTQRGILRADELVLGDVIRTCALPEPCHPKTPAQIPDEIGWLIGLYLAEGSRSGDCIQIAGHVKEAERYERLCRLAESYGGTCRLHRTGGNCATIDLSGKVLNAIIDTYIAGRMAGDKHLATLCWQRSNTFLEMVLMGYLSGDGHYEARKERWRIGFTRNCFLENDLRTLCARLGIRLILKPSTVTFEEKAYPSFKGEIRLSRGIHPNNKEAGEVVSIGWSRARQFWDIAVADDPHLFALASGVLTHNCQPESVKDRTTRSHEYVFLFSKAPRYFYDADAIREPHTMKPQRRLTQRHSARDEAMRSDKKYRYRLRDEPGVEGHPAGRNRRTVWSINTEAFDAHRLGIEDVNHFAVMPPALAEICVLASTSPQACEVCGAPWKRHTARATRYEGGSGRAGRGPDDVNSRGKWAQRQHGRHLKLGPVVEVQTLGWTPTCKCPESKGTGRCLILDPFAGASTVLAVAAHLGRDYLGIELNAGYLRLGEQNIRTTLEHGLRRRPSRNGHNRAATAGFRQLLLFDEEGLWTRE